MLLTSFYPVALDWSMYDTSDRIYWIPSRTGTIQPLKWGDLNDPRQAGFQVKLTNHADGAVIYQPGKIFQNDEQWFVNDQGQVVSAAAAATVTESGSQTEFFGQIVQFFDAASSDYKVSIKTSVEESIDQSGETTTKVSNETSDGTTTKVGASAEGKFPPIGIKLSGDLTTTVKTAMTESIAYAYKYSIKDTSTMSQSIDGLPIKANTLTAIVLTIKREFVTGTVKAGPLTSSYDATRQLVEAPSRIVEVASPDQLPPDLLAEYEKDHPAYQPPSTSTSTTIGYSEVDVVNQAADGHTVDVYLDDGGQAPVYLDTLAPGDAKQQPLMEDNVAYRVIIVDTGLEGCDGTDAVTNAACQRTVAPVLSAFSGGAYHLVVK